MKTNAAKRRNDSLASRVAGRMGVHNPLFNLREIAKNLVLLEDHLSHAYKICPDCIRKHLLAVEALGEEATTLDIDGFLRGSGEAIAESSRRWMERFSDGDDILVLTREIRQVRKSLAPLICDPRTTSKRVASRFQSLDSCNHPHPSHPSFDK